MLATPRLHSALLAVGFITFGFAVSGCATLSLNKTAEAEPPMEMGPTYTVALKSSRADARIHTGHLDQPTTIQQVLEETGALAKFRSMNIIILRRVKETGRPLRLVVDFETSKRHVKPEQNYAIHPDDQILVESTNSSPLDALMSRISN